MIDIPGFPQVGVPMLLDQNGRGLLKTNIDDGSSLLQVNGTVAARVFTAFSAVQGTALIAAGLALTTSDNTSGGTGSGQGSGALTISTGAGIISSGGLSVFIGAATDPGSIAGAISFQSGAGDTGGGITFKPGAGTTTGGTVLFTNSLSASAFQISDDLTNTKIGVFSSANTPVVQPVTNSVESIVTGLFNLGWISSGTAQYSRRKTADQSITSSTTLTNDTHLFFSIAASEEWIAEFILDAGAALGTTGLKVAITTPAGATQNIRAILVADVVAVANAYKRTTTSGAALDFTALQLVGVGDSEVRVSVWVLNGATPGTVQLQFAQSTSSVTAVTLRKGSFMNANRAA